MSDGNKKVADEENKIMNEFKTNNEMELLITAKKHQPELYAKLPAATKMSLGIYESTKNTTNGLTTDEVLRLRGLKLSLSQDNLPPSERITLALKISQLEAK